jgi:hypothetical protein
MLGIVCDFPEERDVKVSWSRAMAQSPPSETSKESTTISNSDMILPTSSCRPAGPTKVPA